MMIPATEEFDSGFDFVQNLRDQNKPRSLEKYQKRIEDIQATHYSLKKTREAFDKYKKYRQENTPVENFLDKSAQTALTAKALQKGYRIYSDFTGMNPQEYNDFKNTIETDFIMAKMRNEGIPITNETLKHYLEIYDPRSLTIGQFEDVLSKEEELNHARNAHIGLETQTENPAKIGSNEDFYKATGNIIGLLRDVKQLQNAPTAYKVNRFPNTEELADENTEILKGDLQSLIRANPNATEDDIFKKMTGVPLQEANEGNIEDFLNTYKYASGSKKWDPAYNKLIGLTLGSALAVVEAPIVTAGILAASAGIPIYQGIQQYRSAKSSGVGTEDALLQGASTAGQAALEELDTLGVGKLVKGVSKGILKTYQISRNLLNRRNKQIPENTNEPEFGVDTVIGKASSKGIKKVEDRIRSQSEELARKSYSKNDKEIENILSTNNKVHSKILEDYREIKMSGDKNPPAETIRKIIKNYSDRKSIEKLSDKVGLSEQSVREILENLEEKIFPGMNPYTKASKVITKIDKNRGKSIPIERTIKDIKDSDGFTPEDIKEMSENILETTISSDSIRKALDEKTIEGIDSVQDIIKKVIKGIKFLTVS